MERSNRELRIGLLTDALPERTLEEVVDWASRTGLVEDLELGVGGYSPAPHCDVAALLGKSTAVREWRRPIVDAGLGISALNVSGNPLHPNPEIAARHDADLRQAIRLAAELGVNRVVAMSGCPGASATDRSAPHFSGGGWLPDLERIADWQWRERVAPYWIEISALARREHPQLLICFELHPGTYVYNFETFSRLRQLGSNLGVNLDPSHFFWQSMDPLAMIEALGDRIGHVHGKDTTIHQRRLALNGMLDNRWPSPPDDMPWNFATVGRGHDEEWWRRFVGMLRDQGFGGTISIEYEDPFVPVEESILESARVLAAVTRD
ncbi:MAG TPA: sugar phosphate isomerase/epimerase [Candidatus Baltobacterales bacterium]|nr:sugar phosphate isomerase/epimerase [Candidatus Baltobacterales bacterium]